MAKYRITRETNMREGGYLDIYATGDEQAKGFLQNAIKSNRDDWEYVEDSLGSAHTDDAVFNLECVELDGRVRPVQMGFRPKSQMPYSDEAREFVRKVADFRITDADSVEHEILNGLLRDARKLCGME